MREFIDSYLRSKQMTYYTLSKITGIHKNVLYDFKRGVRNLSFEKLCLISEVLDFSLDELKKHLDKNNTNFN